MSITSRDDLVLAQCSVLNAQCSVLSADNNDLQAERSQGGSLLISTRELEIPQSDILLMSRGSSYCVVTRYPYLSQTQIPTTQVYKIMYYNIILLSHMI